MNRLPPWLEKPYAELVADLDKGRLPHALLIHGPGGWGESTLAEAFALRLIERSADRNGAAEIAHPDLRWVVPEGDGGQILIDTVRDAAEFIVRTPQIAPRKVAVIPNADAMNGHSANALLKTLEEPPPNSYVILVSDSVRDLLPTVRSRCRWVPVRPAGEPSTRTWISEQAPNASADTIAALCFEYGEAPFHVVAALERAAQPISKALHAVAAGEIHPLRAVEAWAKHLSPELVERWMRYVARAIAARLAPNGTAEDPIATVLRRVEERPLFLFWEQLARDRQLLRGTTNANARLMFETRMLAWRDLTTPT